MTTSKESINKKSTWFLYVLTCTDNTLYTGITTDLTRRLQEHNEGTASRYTRSRLPVKLFYYEQCRNQSSALKKECAIKRLSRLEKEAYINKKSASRSSRNLNKLVKLISGKPRTAGVTSRRKSYG